MKFKEWIENVGESFFHTTTREAAENIFKNGFATGINNSLELGPGVYLSVNRKTFPTHLSNRSQNYEVVTIEVEVDPSVKFVEIKDGPNTAIEILRSIYGYDQGNKVYGKINVFNPIGSNKSMYNWRLLHNIAIKEGYDGIRRTGVDHTAGNRDVVVFDASKVKPIRIIDAST